MFGQMQALNSGCAGQCPRSLGCLTPIVATDLYRHRRYHSARPCSAPSRTPSRSSCRPLAAVYVSKVHNKQPSCAANQQPDEPCSTTEACGAMRASRLATAGTALLLSTASAVQAADETDAGPRTFGQWVTTIAAVATFIALAVLTLGVGPVLAAVGPMARGAQPLTLRILRSSHEWILTSCRLSSRS